MLNDGELKNWPEWEKSYLDVADCLVRADEIERAMKILGEMLPAYYRDNPPPAIIAARDKVLQYAQNLEDYSTNPLDQDVSVSKSVWMFHNLRAKLILADVQKFNSQGITPNLLEFGPGEYWLPIGLKENKCQFKYKALGVHDTARAKAKDILGDMMVEAFDSNPIMYISCEIIEHLWNVDEIRQNLVKLDVKPKIIHVSTPKYTPHNGEPPRGWKGEAGGGGHLRMYTPHEFQGVVRNLFPEYDWRWYDNFIQHMRGELPNGSQVGFKTNGS
jgi:hypothetical protein